MTVPRGNPLIFTEARKSFKVGSRFTPLSAVIRRASLFPLRTITISPPSSTFLSRELNPFSYAESTVSQTLDECGDGTLRSSEGA